MVVSRLVAPTAIENFGEDNERRVLGCFRNTGDRSFEVGLEIATFHPHLTKRDGNGFCFRTSHGKIRS